MCTWTYSKKSPSFGPAAGCGPNYLPSNLASPTRKRKCSALASYAVDPLLPWRSPTTSVVEAVAQVLAVRTTQEWMELLGSGKLVVAGVQSLAAALEMERSRELIVAVSSPDGDLN